MSISINKPDIIYAFDIDGVLTEDEGMELYNETVGKPGVEVGIVTARDKAETEAFIRDNNLDPAFVDAVDLKFNELMVIKRASDAEEFVYVGSYIRDRIAARVSGWEYIQV